MSLHLCSTINKVKGVDLRVDGDLNGDTWLDVDGGDLLHGLRWGVKVDDALVDAHLEAIVGVGTLTTWRLAGGNNQLLGWHTHRSLAVEALVLGALNEVRADLLEGLDVAGSQGDANLVNGVTISLEVLSFSVISHCV